MSDQPFTRADSQAADVRPLKDIADTPECARISHGRLSKTDLKFWKGRIFKPLWRRSDGQSVQSANFAVAISFRGRRIKWTLGTPNREAAAARAREIFLFLQANGWEAALARYRPQEAPKPRVSELTLGEFLSLVRATKRLSHWTFTDYAQALRRIVAAIAAIPNSRERGTRTSDVRLAEITSEKIERWKRQFLNAAKSDPISQRSARVSVNSYLRRAKCLFTKDLLAQLDVTLPDPLLFAGVKFEKRVHSKYHSNFDIRLLVAAARVELAASPDKIELFKIFVLAAMCGLRRREIDLLPWSAFHFDQGLLRIEATEFFQPKTDESNAELPLEPEVVALFRGYQVRATSQFVIESAFDPAPGTAYLHYRCAHHFRELARWLRLHGVQTARPLHALRKEFGSLINRTHGIHAASRALRHASIGITAEIYVDARVHTTSGLGGLLVAEGSNVLPMCPDAPSASRTAAAGQ